MHPSEPDLARSEFVLSAARVRDLPPDRGREVAFAGRSNAGKSSLLNALCGHRGLARVSRTPGRTQMLNVFQLEEGRRIVDLPGYGYAHAPRATRDAWLELVADYLQCRQSLCGVVWVMDIRHPLHPTDLRFQALIGSAAAPIRVALTKADKLGHGAIQTTLRAVQSRLRPYGLEVAACSARTHAGIEQLQRWLRATLTGKEKAAPE